jgi:hypothetical protein
MAHVLALFYHTEGLNANLELGAFRATTIADFWMC